MDEKLTQLRNNVCAAVGGMAGGMDFKECVSVLEKFRDAPAANDRKGLVMRATKETNQNGKPVRSFRERNDATMCVRHLVDRVFSDELLPHLRDSPLADICIVLDATSFAEYRNTTHLNNFATMITARENEIIGTVQTEEQLRALLITMRSFSALEYWDQSVIEMLKRALTHRNILGNMDSLYITIATTAMAKLQLYDAEMAEALAARAVEIHQSTEFTAANWLKIRHLGSVAWSLHSAGYSSTQLSDMLFEKMLVMSRTNHLDQIASSLFANETLHNVQQLLWCLVASGQHVTEGFHEILEAVFKYVDPDALHMFRRQHQIAEAFVHDALPTLAENAISSELRDKLNLILNHEENQKQVAGASDSPQRGGMIEKLRETLGNMGGDVCVYELNPTDGPYLLDAKITVPGDDRKIGLLFVGKPKCLRSLEGKWCGVQSSIQEDLKALHRRGWHIATFLEYEWASVKTAGLRERKVRAALESIGVQLPKKETQQQQPTGEGQSA
eukprot:GDKI01047063.1.p1 GENE.GDKI01047063.1~~GDKI01047063.1.p1  ORF type:complete len:529 (+),score=104.23 GDKI01047063.1:82-1587(+)